MTQPGYEPHFDIDFQRGLVGEALVGSFLEDLAGNLIEVKTDYKAGQTGNTYIETYQRDLEGRWGRSGINVTQAGYFCIAGPGGNGFIAIKTDVLRELAMNAPKTECNTENLNTRATVGRLVRLDQITAAVFKKGK